MDINQNLQSLQQWVGRIKESGLGAPIVILMLLAMVVLPLPALILDVFFTFNIALSLVVLLVSVYVLRPLEFAVFPSLLLIATLLRLALNIASTRIVLLEGHTGTDAAGQVIESFGNFVIGGNYAVGMVVFAILVIINFVVITKGAGRVSEVSARFVLDAMPGKQMAIDADLNAGIIDQEEAGRRRDDIINEADFYGSMDGASKFVRGDAVAGILILVINIIGGLAIGMLQHGMPLSEALHNYTLLTIGDGLVAQIPALLLSTATAIIVTRVSSSKTDVGDQVFAQILENPKALGMTAGVMGFLGIIPGMPNVAFLLLAGAAGGGAYMLAQRQKLTEARVAEPPAPLSPESTEITWDDVGQVDVIGLEVGYRLIPLVDKAQGGQLMGRIKGIRKKLSQELGFLVPAVHIRDNLDLSPTAYRITLMGVVVAEAEVFPDQEMAINPGQVFGELQGTPGKDPAFGLDAIWIAPTQRDNAQSLGYTVVDTSTVIATHLSHVLQSHVHEMLGREDVQQMMDKLATTSPKLVEDMKDVPTGLILRVLQNLLSEKVPIKDMRSIAETLADYSSKSQDPDVLTAAVRTVLTRTIFQNINGIDEEMPVITLDPALEQILHQAVQMAGGEGGGIEPTLAENLHRALEENARKQEMEGKPAVLLVSPAVRAMLARFVRHTIPGLNVLAFNEIPNDKSVKIVATIGGA